MYHINIRSVCSPYSTTFPCAFYKGLAHLNQRSPDETVVRYATHVEPKLYLMDSLLTYKFHFLAFNR